MSKTRLVALFLAFLLLGIVGGWVFRRLTHPTIEDRARDAANELRGKVEKLTH
jgi:hypothetical protein